MFFRRKRSGKAEYLQIVKNERVDGKPRQSVVATLGRIDDLVATGEIDRLLRSGARFAATAVVLTAFDNGDTTKIVTRQLGPALAFERLWQETGGKRVIGELAQNRHFEFDLERAVFLSVLHRLFDPGSDRAAEKWRHDLVIPAPPAASAVFTTLGIALPPLVRSAQPPPPRTPRKPQKHRRRPRRRSANVVSDFSNPLM